MSENRFAIISSQAFSLSNFRGPLIRDIVARGWKVYAIAPDYDEQTRAAVLELGAQPVDCPLERTGINPIADLQYIFRLAKILRQLEIKAILGYFIKPVIFGTIAAWMAGVPNRFALIAGLGYVFVSSSDRQESLGRKILRYFVSYLYSFALARAKIVFFQNNDDLEEFVALGLIHRTKARNTDGTGVDLNEWKPTEPVTSPVTFLLAARLLREKGIPEFATAARRVGQARPDTKFILLGSLDPNPGGLSRAEIEQWVEEGILEWHGHVAVSPWLERTSVYVLPSYYREGVPRSIQEAMAMSRAIITTDVIGCRETVIDGVNGYLVPPLDVDALEQAMLRFIDDRSTIESMGIASRKLAEKRFDVRRVNKLMLNTMGI